jgi:outer membrane immunogenic protein
MEPVIVFGQFEIPLVRNLSLVRIDRLLTGEIKMKKLVVALTALAAFTGSAVAADMAPRYSKAPPPAPVAVANWTGCYIGGGGGYGLWNQENTEYTDPGRVQVTATTTAGGRGYFGTVQGGCDYQFPVGSWNMVIGAFGDYDFSSLKGQLQSPGGAAFGTEKMSSAWSGGGRIGLLVTPSLLTYFSAGYTEATFDRVDFFNNAPPFATANVYLNKRTYKGYFIGAGDEYALSFLPGLFWKTEYRFSQFDLRTDPFLNSITNTSIGFADDSKKYVHTVRSELVYRFNWGGPVVAKY